MTDKPQLEILVNSIGFFQEKGSVPIFNWDNAELDLKKQEETYNIVLQPFGDLAKGYELGSDQDLKLKRLIKIINESNGNITGEGALGFTKKL